MCEFLFVVCLIACVSRLYLRVLRSGVLMASPVLKRTKRALFVLNMTQKSSPVIKKTSNLPLFIKRVRRLPLL